jgi:hypothetical protein
MKPSKLKKNKTKSIRVNEYVLIALKNKGLSAQGAFDKFIDNNLVIKKLK